LIAQLEATASELDALIVADYITAGVITPRVRAALIEIATAHPRLVMVVDSRLRIGQYPGMALKPNDVEAAAALGLAELDVRSADSVDSLSAWQREQGRPLLSPWGRGCLR
jgi:bifunctional ADP-heptose synthase (sugar kinase/adenylyltransferase)